MSERAWVDEEWEDTLARTAVRPTATIWIVGESDDHLEAAFTTEEAAQACLDAKTAPIKAKVAEKHPEWADTDYWEQFSHWWIDELPLDPAA